MEITPIGIICILACVFAVARPLSLGLLVFGLFMPLQTAAAFNLWAVGGLSIICSQVLIGALTLGVILRPKLAISAVHDIMKRPAAIIFAVFVAYGVFTAFFFPRLFGGEVLVYSLERPPEGYFGIPLSTLHPTSGNISQSFYLIANFFLFSILAFIVSRPNGVRRAVVMLNAATGVHLFFAVLSALPPAGPIAAIMELIRTANYAILTEHTMIGMRRIIGSYAEASAFGSMSAGLFAYNFMRFIQTRGLWFSIASVLLLACVVFSFSTTAYAVLAILIFIWCVHTSLSLMRGGLSPGHLTTLFLMALTASVIVSLFFFEPARALAAEIYERLFGAKLESASGVERSAWNMRGVQNMLDTNGFGVGIGSARTSSLATVLLSNVGVPGTLLYIGFLYAAFLRAWPRSAVRADDKAQRLMRRIFSAARAGAVAMLLAHLIAGGNVDGGVQFFVFAAVASGAYCPSKKRRRIIAVEPPTGAGRKLVFGGRPIGEFGRIPVFGAAALAGDASSGAGARDKASG